MRALVTGAAGFIGSHLCERLIKEGHEVVGIDNFSVGKNNAYYIRNENITKFWDEWTCDWVFHLAALADIVPSVKKPVEYHDNNVNGTLRMLEWAREKGVKKFVYAASSSCYGEPDMYPTPEDAAMRPRYPYALTKMLGEHYVMHWAQVYGLPAISLRLFNVYGPRARTSGTYGAVFGVFLAQIANGLPVTIVGDGTQERDFVFVSDVVEAFVRAAKSDLTCEVFNVGSDHSVPVNRIAELLGAKEKTFIPWRPGEPKKTLGDITKIYKALDWYPEFNIEDGCSVMRTLIPQYKDAPVWTPDSIKTATKEWFECLKF